MINIRTIAAVKGNKNSACISVCFKDCFESINQLKQHPWLSVNDKVYRLEYTLCAVTTRLDMFCSQQCMHSSVIFAHHA